MALRPILKLPDPRLRLRSEPVGPVDAELRTLVRDMLDTMYDAPGIGLAAIQVGVPKRLIVIDVGKAPDDRQPIVLIDPEITSTSDEKRVHEEGCLSIPEYYEEVERPERIGFRYRDLNGGTVEAEADGLLATCVQHEIDHIDGVLFIDHLSKLKRDRVVKKFVKAARREGDEP